MNDEQFEVLLRKAPRPPAPGPLLETLQANIALPRRAETVPAHRTEALPLLRRCPNEGCAIGRAVARASTRDGTGGGVGVPGVDGAPVISHP